MNVKIEEMIKIIMKKEKPSNGEEIILKENTINVKIMQISWKKKRRKLAIKMLSSRITILKIILTLI